MTARAEVRRAAKVVGRAVAGREAFVKDPLAAYLVFDVDGVAGQRGGAAAVQLFDDDAAFGVADVAGLERGIEQRVDVGADVAAVRSGRGMNRRLGFPALVGAGLDKRGEAGGAVVCASVAPSSPREIACAGIAARHLDRWIVATRRTEQQKCQGRTQKV